MTTEAKNAFAEPLDLGELGELIRDDFAEDPTPHVIIESLVNESTETNDSQQKIEESRMFIFEEKVVKETQQRQPIQQSQSSSSSSSSYGSNSTSNQNQNNSYNRSGYGNSSSGYSTSSYGYQTISAEEAKRRAEEEAKKKALEDATRRSHQIIEQKQKRLYDLAAKAEGKTRSADSDIFSRMDFFASDSERLGKTDRKEMLNDCISTKNNLSTWFSALAEIGKINRREIR